MDEDRVVRRGAWPADGAETATADHRSTDRADGRVAHTGPDPALRDATAIAQRAADDEEAAAEARRRLRHAPPPELEPDDAIGPLLRPDEHVLACRRSVAFDRRDLRSAPDGTSASLAGDLYLTSRRLVLIGRVTLAFELAGIEEVIVSAERILLVGRDGTGVALDVDRPRTLRVEIAAARAAARG